MGSLRTQETKERYGKLLASGVLEHGCVLCKMEPIKEFKHWKIIKNDFPYDKIAKTHHMIIPVRCVEESGLTDEELKELKEIKHNYLFPTYEWILEATEKKKSVPGHFHLHLIISKD